MLSTEKKLNLLAAVASLLVGVCMILIVKFAAGFWVENHGNPLERSLRILESDARWGWRQKPDLNVTFYGHPFRTNRLGLRAPPLPESGSWILVAGPSSTMGWAIASDDTYSAVLEKSLARRTRGWSVVNGGEIGFSSEQGLSWLKQKEFWQNPPKSVVWAYGINDLDRHRFFFDNDQVDRAEFARPKGFWENSVNKVAELLYPLPSLVARLTNLISAGRCQTGSPKPLRARVPIDELAGILREFKKMAAEKGFKPLVLSTVYQKELQGPIHETYAEVRAQIEAIENERNIATLQRLAENPLYRNEAMMALGNCEASRYEPERIARDVFFLNKSLARAAGELQLPFLDLKKVVFNTGRWDDFFVDPVHFSKPGHQRIAQEIDRLLQSEKIVE